MAKATQPTVCYLSRCNWKYDWKFLQKLGIFGVREGDRGRFLSETILHVDADEVMLEYRLNDTVWELQDYEPIYMLG